MSSQRTRSKARARRVPSRNENIVEFDKPPVSEVIFGIGFKAPEGFREAHFGLFWNEIRDEFPVAEIKTPIAPPPPEHLQIDLSTAPPQRHFFRSGDGSELLQIQSNRLLFNWIKIGDAPYPRYRKVYPRFTSLCDRFSRFLTENSFEKPIIRELRLEYLNHIAKDQIWKTPSDVHKIFPDFRVARRGRRFLISPQTFNLQVRYPMEREGTHLDVALRTGRRELEELITLQLSVIGAVEEPSDKEIRSWFDMAREAIDLSFTDLASPRAKEAWGIHHA